MKTKSIYQGFLVHITVAALMDWLALRRRHCTPLTWSAPVTPVTCSEQANLRDALAWQIEKVAIGVFVCLLAIAIVLVVRDRRRRAARI